MKGQSKAPPTVTGGAPRRAGHHSAPTGNDTSRGGDEGAPTAVPAADALPVNRILFGWQERIRDDLGLHTTTKAVAWALGTRMDLYGRGAHPSLTTLARDVGCSRSTAVRHLDHLENLGYLIRQRPKVRGSRKATRYVAAVPSSPTDATSGTHETTEEERVVPPMHTSSAAGDTLTPPGSSTGENRAPTVTTLGDDEEAEGDHDGGAGLAPCPHCDTPVARGDDCAWCGEALDWTQRLALSMPGVQIKAVAS